MALWAWYPRLTKPILVDTSVFEAAASALKALSFVTNLLIAYDLNDLPEFIHYLKHRDVRYQTGKERADHWNQDLQEIRSRFPTLFTLLQKSTAGNETALSAALHDSQEGILFLRKAIQTLEQNFHRSYHLGKIQNVFTAAPHIRSEDRIAYASLLKELGAALNGPYLLQLHKGVVIEINLSILFKRPVTDLKSLLPYNDPKGFKTLPPRQPDKEIVKLAKQLSEFLPQLGHPRWVKREAAHKAILQILNSNNKIGTYTKGLFIMPFIARYYKKTADLEIKRRIEAILLASPDYPWHKGRTLLKDAHQNVELGYYKSVEGYIVHKIDELTRWGPDPREYPLVPIPRKDSRWTYYYPLRFPDLSFAGAVPNKDLILALDFAAAIRGKEKRLSDDIN